MSRRIVRVDRALFDDIDRQLGPTRDGDGGPSASDFVAFELPTIVEEFATRFDDLPTAYVGRDDYRVLVSSGTLVRAALVIGQRRSDDSVVLLAAELEV